MKVVLTGATGFIGKHLISELISKGCSIVAIVRPGSDISHLQKNNIPVHYYNGEYNSLFNFFVCEKPDGIIHLASLILVEHTSDQITELVNSNILFPTHLIEAAANADIKWFLNTGTFWQNYEAKEYSPVNLYAATKQAFEDLAQYYFETKNINFVTFKLYDTFGPNDTRSKIFNLWLKSAISGELLEMSAGEQVIDISYIDNITAGYSELIHLLSEDLGKKLCGKTFAIKTKERLTLKELAKVFEKVTGKKLNIAWGRKSYRQREVMIPWQQSEEIPGWVPKVSLEEGIRLFYKNCVKK